MSYIFSLIGQKPIIKELILRIFLFVWAGVVQSIQQLATGCVVQRSNPGEERFSAPVQTDPGAYPASYTMDTGSVSRDKAAGTWR